MSIPNPVPSSILPKFLFLCIFPFQLFSQQHFPAQPLFYHQNQLFSPNSLQPHQFRSLPQDGLHPNPLSPHFTSNSLARGCKHFCSISENGSMPCWNDTLHYYEQMLVGLLRRTVAVQSNRIVWMIANRAANGGGQQIDYAFLANECYQRLKNMPMRQRVEDDNNWKDADFVYFRLSTALVQNVQQIVNKMMHSHYGEEFPQLDVECPHGCERSWDMWKWLFIGSISATFLLLAFLGFFVFRLDQREQSSWNLEAEEFRENVKKIRPEIGIGPRQQTQMRTFKRIE